MTSSSSPPYPAEYYYPEFINSRPDNPIIPPSKPPPLSESVTVIKNDERSTNQIKKSRKKNLAVNVVTDHGLADVDITTAAKSDFKKNLIRNPAEKNIPKLIVNKNIVKQSVRFPANPITEIKTIPNGHTNEDLSKKRPDQTEKLVENYHRKKEESAAIEPIEYDENAYEGPFGLTRKGALKFYISMSIITLLAVFFLIMTGVFYANNYPASSSNTVELVGMCVCAFVFYLGLQLILIGIWHQKYRYENPVKKEDKKSSAKLNDSTEHLKTSMENNEFYDDYPYQQPMDYPPYVSNVNEQTLLEQPGAATGAGYYEPVVWPSNIQFQTQPNPKFSQAMEWSMETQQQKTPPNELQILKSYKIKKSKGTTQNTVVTAEPIIEEFDSLPMNSNMTEQRLPNLPKAPETTALIQTIARMEPVKSKSPANTNLFPKKNNQIRPFDTPLDILSANTSSYGTLHKHHHHRRHHSHHRHHHQRRHHHHRHSYSPCSQCSDYSRDNHHKHTHNDHHYNHTYTDHHHRHQPIALPRIVTPRFPKIIIPTQRTIATTTYRETGVNTGHETKIMSDSSVTADLGDLPSTPDNRFGQIPVVRRTVIVEPYPAQPNSQIIVRPQKNMTGKIRLSHNETINGDSEAIIYPSTVYFTKKTKKKKKSTIVNNNMIEDLHLEDIHDDGNAGFSPKLKTSRLSTRKTIKNAFYN